MCFYDVEPVLVFCNELRRARKDHRCCDCCRIIKRGERYEYIAGVCDGDFENWKTCRECVSLREAIAKIEISHGCDKSEAYPGFGFAREAAHDYDELKQLIVVGAP